MKPPILQLDTLDDRREVHQLLERLPPARRLQWLQWCCDRVTGPHGDKIKVAPHSTGGAMEVFLDFWQLVNNYDLDPVPMVVRLEAAVRRSGGRPSPVGPPAAARR
jgi:hypothetical protein